MDFKGKLEGFKDFDSLLKTLPARVENKVMQGAITGAARVGAKAVASAAPVGPEKSVVRKHRTSAAASAWAKIVAYGHLRKNIKVVRSRSAKRRGQRGAFITIGKAFWGNFLEKGSRHQAARPFFYPAFKAAYKSMIDEIAKRLGTGIEKEASKQTANGKAVRDAIDGI